jgi:hypothetical protein
MANVTATTGWVSGSDDAEPFALSPLTLDAGSNRKLIVTFTSENNTTPEPITITVGGVAPTQTISFTADNTGSSDHHLYFFIWNEAAVASMADGAVSYTDNTTSALKKAAYGMVEDCDQDNLAGAADSDKSDNAQQLVLTTTSGANDLVLVLGRHDINTTTVEFTGVSEIHDSTGHSFGAGNADSVTLDWSTSDACSALAIVLADFVAAGTNRRKRGTLMGVG